MADETVELENMSDDDFMEATESDDPIGTVAEVDNEVVDDEQDGPDEDLDEADVDDQEDTLDDDQSDDEDDESEDSSEEDDGQVDKDTETLDGEQDTEDTPDIDFEAGYKDLFAPFKANGKDMQVDNVEDARRLMQMGVGYQKRMSELKPHLKIIKSLKNNDLLDVDKINRLIDLDKKDPGAIAKLIKEAGVDPLDIDTEDGDKYQPTDHSISDSEFDLDQAIDNIRGNESYDKSIAVMGEQWDQKSRGIIAENPEIVGIIDSHIQSGVFDVVQAHVEKEQTLGRMKGLSNVEAYREATQVLQKNGVLEGDGVKKESDPKNKEPNPLVKEAKKKQEASRKKRKKAAAPIKGKPKSKKSEKDYDKMSDADFMAEVG